MIIPLPLKAPRSVFAIILAKGTGKKSPKGPKGLNVLTGIKCHIKGKRRPANADKLVFPGGGRKTDADPSDLSALLREVYEETGLVVAPISPAWQCYTEMVIRNGKKVKALKAFILCKVVDGELRDTPELKHNGFRSVRNLLKKGEESFARLHHRALQRVLKQGLLDPFATGAATGAAEGAEWPEVEPPTCFPTPQPKPNRGPAQRAS